MSLALVQTNQVYVHQAIVLMYGLSPGKLYNDQYVSLADTSGVGPTFDLLATGFTDAQVVTNVATNLGLADDTAFTAFMTSLVTTFGKGGAVKALVDALPSVATTSAYYSNVTSLNTKVAASITHSAVAGSTQSSTVISSAGVAANQTFTLTTSVDKVADFTGGAGDDTFIGDNTGTDVTSSADTIDGGDGDDILNVFSDGAAASLPGVSNIETLNVYDQDLNIDISAASLASITTANFFRGDGIVGYTLGSAITTVGLNDIVLAGDGAGVADTTITAKAAATSLTLNLTGVSTAAAAVDEDINIVGTGLTDITVNVATDSSADNLDVAGADNININATGDFTTVLASTTTTGVLTLTGAGDIGLGQVIDGIDSVVATGHTGGTTMTLAADNVTATYQFGSGNDVITTSDDGFATADAFSVDAGDGTDTLILAAAADLSSTDESGRYTNFETVRTGDSLDMDLTPWATALEVTGASGKSYTDMTATQAANVTVRGDETSGTFALKTATGTADVLTVTLGTGKTTAAATDLATGVTVTGFETMNIVENGGPTATVGADQTAIVAAFTGATLSDINLSGRAVTLGNIATTVAADIDGSALTGNGATSGAQGLTVSGSAKAGSVITGSDVRDSLTIGAEGSTYNGGAGNDAFSATATLITADGTTDLVLNGGAGTDTLTLTNTTGNTLTDTMFVNVSGMEKLTLTNTGAADTVITTGGSVNSAFADGLTITSGLIAAAQDITINGGLLTVDTTVTIAATTQSGASTETNSIVTGSGADTVTYTDVGWVGVAGGAGGTFAIDTNAGDDTISLTVGTLLQDTTANFITVTGGAGQDSMTKVGVNADDAVGVVGHVTFEFAAGDSNTVNYDTITGFDVNAASLISDELDFEGTAAIGSSTASTDFGTILSHSVTAGVFLFDDAAAYSSALTISSTNLADVVGYLTANLTANETAAFAYDSTGNGSADATMVFHQGSASGVADDLVLLAGVTGVDALITTNVAGAANDVFIA